MEKALTEHIAPGAGPLSLDAYERVGGYQALRKALRDLSPAQVQEVVRKSNLRGRGGAGFPTGMKWGFMPMGPGAPRPKYVIANADEMEPGTFKDRFLLEAHPHQLIEGLILAAYAVEAQAAFIFLRHEYVGAGKAVLAAIDEARRAGYLGSRILGADFDLEMRLHTSVGRYMCGEETGQLNAIEGGRALPRSKPPHPTTSGLWGMPTVVNNVETLSNIPHIVRRGAEWFRGLSKSADGGAKLYSVAGRVRNPGLWELPMGTTARELIEERAGGMRDGLRLKGFLPGGASTDFLTAERLDVKMDFDGVQKAGSRLGTGAIIVLDDGLCPVGALLSLERFFARESCGWCTPCRDGLPWAAQLLEEIESGRGAMEDLDTLAELCLRLAPGNTFCALAPGAVEPLQSALRHFRADFERHVVEKRCPWR